MSLDLDEEIEEAEEKKQQALSENQMNDYYYHCGYLNALRDIKNSQ